MRSTGIALGDLPPTPRSIVRERPELFAALTSERPFKYYETSGTTGRPMPTYRLREDIVWNVVSLTSAWRRVLQDEDRVAILLPSDLSPIGDTVSNVCELIGACHVRCYPFTLGIVDWDRIGELFLRFRPTAVFASPGVALQAMRLFKSRGTFARVREDVRKLMLLGEVCTTSLRERLAEAWGAQTYNASYGGTEMGTIAGTCRYGALHAFLQSFYLELWNGDEVLPLCPGRSGELVVTTLNAHARPLLRYLTGDTVEIEAGESCGCRLWLPRLRIRGRAQEAVTIHGVPADVEGIEGVVYRSPDFTGYLVELSDDGSRTRLILERDPELQGDGSDAAEAVRLAFLEHSVRWDAVLVVSQLPTMTKSGAGQKNWKRTNVRVLA
jgi:phenylacetate-CoA ligase